MTVLEFPKRIPRWQQIAESVSRDLRSACFADDRLPTEAALARRFGVNRHTIRRAIAALAGKGLVRVEHGRGTVVCRGRAAPQNRSRYTVSAASEGDEFHRRVIRSMRSPANSRTAKNLEIAPGTAVIEIETLAELGGSPISFEVHRFRAERCLTLPYAFLLGLSITDAIEACGIGKRKPVVTRLLARLSSEAEARYLEQPVSALVLQMERVHTDTTGTPVHCSTSIFPADRVQVVSELLDPTIACCNPEQFNSVSGWAEPRERSVTLRSKSEPQVRHLGGCRYS